MQDAIRYLTCLVVLARLLKPNWRWRNAMLGLAFTYSYIGSDYADKAIDSCLQERTHSCEPTLVMLLLLHLVGTVVLGRYGADLEAVIVRFADRTAGRRRQAVV